MPQEEWRVVIPDHHPGYITWDRFLANAQRMATNRTNSEVLGGPAREGLCLLQGMLVCGHCGRRLSVRYTGNGGIYPMYECNWQHRDAVAHHAYLARKPRSFVFSHKRQYMPGLRRDWWHGVGCLRADTIKVVHCLRN
jgi:Recombinase zinc beta ribbon domain